MKYESRICEWMFWNALRQNSIEILCVSCAKDLKQMLGISPKLLTRRTLKACQGCGKWLHRTDGTIEVVKHL